MVTSVGDRPACAVPAAVTANLPRGPQSLRHQQDWYAGPTALDECGFIESGENA
jgi:hypothetical protein